MLKVTSSVRTTAARHSLVLLVVGLLGVACSSASISDETDSGTELPADQAGDSEGDLDDEAADDDQGRTQGFALDGEPIVVVSNDVDCVISPRVIVDGDTSVNEVLRDIGMNVPKLDPEHCYLFSAEIPDDLRRYHADVHQKLIDYVGGYDRYVHLSLIHI